MEKERYNGIDIIKILAIIFVPLLHFYLNYDFGKINMVHFGNIIQIMFRWLAFSCIGLFIMCSGYLLSEKKISKKYYYKIFYFLLIYAVALGIQHIVLDRFEPNFIINFFIMFFQFGGYFWYVAFYICLYSLIPYLNIVIDKMNMKQYNIFLITLVFLTSLAITVNSIPNLYGGKIIFLPGSFMVLWPSVYYYIGACFKKFNFKGNKIKYIILLILVLSFISILNFVYSKKGPAFFTGGGYGNIISVIVTTCIFGVLYKIKIKNKIFSSIIKFCASLTFETYLALCLSDVITRKIIKDVLNISFVSYKYIIIVVPINFLIAFIIGIFIHFFAKLIVFVFNKIKLKLFKIIRNKNKKE